ncbi:MAG: sugar phosphate isomerase/epimerase [Clostridia bacterium]|nr:sugar phosphate isomerase/epimerase [Clostridia bacterium]
MKLGMTSFTLRNENPENVLLYAKEAGVQGIEWGVGEHVNLEELKTADEIKALSEKYQMKIFSLGAYCRMDNPEDALKNVEAAKRLGAPIIRVWAGNKALEKCDEDYINTIVENTKNMADEAGKYGIKIGFEFHHSTLTETAECAIDLIRNINKPNVGLYWQPDRDKSDLLNNKEKNMVLPYCVGNMHIQNYTKEGGYMLVEEISDALHLYYDDIKNENYNLMIEFVKDASVENLKKDAETLSKIILNNIN